MCPRLLKRKKNENKTEDRRCVVPWVFSRQVPQTKKHIKFFCPHKSWQRKTFSCFFLFKKIPIYKNNNNNNVVISADDDRKILIIITLCMVYSRSSGGSCVGCRSQNVKNAWDTCSTGRVSRRCANVCVRLGGVCAWTLLGIRCTCVDADL